jgi:hypothetical protein
MNKYFFTTSKAPSEHFDIVFKGMFKKAKLYGLVRHTPFFYQVTSFFKVSLLKVKIRLFFYWATSAHM